MLFRANYFICNYLPLRTTCILYTLSISTAAGSCIDSSPCKRTRDIAAYTQMPLAVASIIRIYELLNPQHNITVSAGIRAMCLLPRNRIVIATDTGYMCLFSYLSLKNTHTWRAKQKYISKIEFSSVSAEPTDERIISTDQIVDNVSIWNGLGQHLCQMRNFCTYHPCLSHPCSFDLTTASMPYVLHKINSFAHKPNSPFAIQRKDCEHVVMMDGKRFVAGFRSGALEVRSFNASVNARSPYMAWERVLLNKSNTRKVAVTALFKLTRNKVVVGFQNGVVEIWNIAKKVLQKKWKAHVGAVTNIGLCSDYTLMTTSEKLLVGWKLPTCAKVFQMTRPHPILSMATSASNSEYKEYLILCFKDSPIEVWFL